MSSFGTWVGQNLFFSDTLESDTRKPRMIFSMPKIILQTLHMEDDGGENKFGILIPYLEFWIAMVMVRGYDVIPSSSILFDIILYNMFSNHIIISLYLCNTYLR